MHDVSVNFSTGEAIVAGPVELRRDYIERGSHFFAVVLLDSDPPTPTKQTLPACPFRPVLRMDPGSSAFLIPRPGMNISDHISERLETIFLG